MLSTNATFDKNRDGRWLRRSLGNWKKNIFFTFIDNSNITRLKGLKQFHEKSITTKSMDESWFLVSGQASNTLRVCMHSYDGQILFTQMVVNVALLAYSSALTLLFQGIKTLPLLVTERWVRSWSRSTGSQLAGDLSHPPSGRLPLLSARPAVTFPVAEHPRSLVGTHFTVPRRVEGWIDHK